MPCSAQTNQNLKTKLDPIRASPLNLLAFFFLFSSCPPHFKSNASLVTAISFIAEVKEASQGIWRQLLGLSLQTHVNQRLCFQPSCISENIKARSCVLQGWACAAGLFAASEYQAQYPPTSQLVCRHRWLLSVH